jgi:hypothetical protein
MVTLAALLAAAAAYAAYCSFTAFRWGERKRFWLFLCAIFPLAALPMALLWTGIGYPRLHERLAGNMGFGPEWNCSSDGNGAGVCLRKPPASMPPSTAEP